MTPAHSVRWLDVAENPVAALAQWIAATQTEQLPDLSRVVILLPGQEAAARLREHLLEATGAGALLGPQVTTLRHWVEAQTPSPVPLLNTHGRELLLVEVLREHPDLLGGGEPWQIADELLRLFEELSLSDTAAQRLLDPAAFSANPALSPFATQADLVRHLWRAWQVQLDAEQRRDRPTLYAQGLETNISESPTWQVYLAGYDWLHARELAWVADGINAGSTHLLVSKDSPLARQLADRVAVAAPALRTALPHHRFLRDVYARDDRDLADRARGWQGADSPLQSRCAIFAASNAEQEAQAIELQTRLWLLQGCESVAIVTEDRRLARRVSALLSRAGIAAQDDAGWPLSTTMAAGALERWLEAVETDFAHQPLIDVLKSGFLRQQAFTGKAVLELQTGIVEGAGVARGLAAYREAIAERAEAFGNGRASYAAPLRNLIDHVAHAATPLLALRRDAALVPAAFIDSLGESLRRLGLWEGYALDPAGQRIQQELAETRLGLEGRALRMGWSECRAWLGRALETHNFRPARAASPVRIINLAQSRLIDDDAVILAGADDRQLPGHPAQHALFNQNVRRELGLKSWTVERERRLRHFTRLLHTAPRLLCTYSLEADGNPQLASPWLALLIAFHQHAFGASLDDGTLAGLTGAEGAAVRSAEAAPLPQPPEQPRPSLPGELLPRKISASGHQQLLNCPYQFFAARGLRLKAREQIAEILDKRDFGVRVHEALQAFHFGAHGVARHYAGPLDTEHRQDAIDYLADVSRRVFGAALAAAFQHQAWWQIWQALIPRYIDWQIERQTRWRATEGEQAPERELANGFVLEGRFDRIDTNDAGYALIDYKTGSVPSDKDILAAEDVQLATYALLVADVVETTYVNLAKPEAPLKTTGLQREVLTQLLPRIEARLETVLNALVHGTALPANGAEAVCRYCEMSGLCRREAWAEATA